MNTCFEWMEEKIDELALKLKEHLKTMSECDTSQKLLAFEQATEHICRKASGELFGCALTQHLSHPNLRRAAIDAIHTHGRRWKSHGLRKVTIRLASGTSLSLETPYFIPDPCAKKGRKRTKRGKKGSGCYPVLLALGIKDRMTPAAMEKLARMVAVCSSLAESHQQLAKAGLHLNIKTVRSFAWEFGWWAIEAHLKRLGQWLQESAQKDSPFSGQRVVVTLDGGRIRVRTPTTKGRRKKNGRRSFEADWSEPRVICLYLIDEEGKKITEAESCWYDAALSDADESFEVLQAHLKGLGVEHAEEVVFIADGAKWIWNRTSELWESLGIKEKVVEIVDFYHAAEHLHEVIELRTSWNKEQREKWFQKHRSLLRKGKVAEVIEAIKTLATGRNKKAYVKKMEYFIGHEERMDYERFKERKWPLGSGAVESAVRRIINQRLKGPGILWLERSAQAMLLLRAYWKAGRWDELIHMTLANISHIQEHP